MVVQKVCNVPTGNIDRPEEIKKYKNKSHKERKKSFLECNRWGTTICWAVGA
jgi:hypothetical protein